MNWFILVCICFAIAALVFFMVKFEGSRIVIGVLLGVGLLGITGFSMYNVNTYYSASGGIFGVIKNVFKKPEVEVVKTVDSAEFNFKNIVMKQTYADDENNYSLMLKSEELFKLDLTKDYFVYINSTPVSAALLNNSISAEFENAFETSDYMFKDTLKFELFFYDNYTNIKLSTNGGKKAYGYWLSYFEKNNLKIKVQGLEENYTGGNFEEEFKKFKLVNFSLNFSDYDDNSNFIMSYRIYAGTKIERVPKTPTRSKYTFLGWSLDGENVLDPNNIIINKNTTFIAVWQAHDFSVNFNLHNGAVQLENSVITENTQINTKYNEKILINAASKDNYTFDYYIFSNSDEVNGKTLIVSDASLNMTPEEIFKALYNIEIGTEGEEVPNFDSLTIDVIWNPDSINMRTSSDTDLMIFISKEIGASPNANPYTWTTEGFIRTMYEKLNAVSSDSLSLNAVMQNVMMQIDEEYNTSYSNSLNASTTNREFLQYVYLAITENGGDN